MNTYTLFGRVVTFDRVIENGAVAVRDGKIEFAGEKDELPCSIGEIFDFTGETIMPGFVDIHCHAAPGVWSHEDPVKMAEYHKNHGTTSLICTYYRDIPHDTLVKALSELKEAMKTATTIKGAHLEGPYLNPEYGTGRLDEGEKVDREKYMQLAASGVIKQWTYAPEVKGTDAFARDIVKCGIVPAIGHSSASPADVARAEKDGARIVTHLFDATGKAIDPPSFDGTIEASFNVAALICDNFYYEIILDKHRVHVRSELLRLAVKTVGVDRIIGITDSCADGEDPQSEINVINGELYGSQMTMDRVAANFFDEGYSLPEVSRITSYTPSRAVGLENVGKIEKGYDADIVVVDDLFTVKKVFTSKE